MSVFGQHLPPPLNLVYPAIHRAESNPVSQRQKHRSSIVAACIEPSDDLMLVQVKTILKTILKAMKSTIFAMIWCKRRAGTSITQHLQIHHDASAESSIDDDSNGGLSDLFDSDGKEDILEGL
jgi:hypothetical protein